MYFIFCRKKYTKSRQIRHYYGEEEMEELENAMRDGNAPNLNPPQDVIAAPLGSVVEIGGSADGAEVQLMLEEATKTAHKIRKICNNKY